MAKFWAAIVKLHCHSGGGFLVFLLPVHCSLFMTLVMTTVIKKKDAYHSNWGGRDAQQFEMNNWLVSPGENKTKNTLTSRFPNASHRLLFFSLSKALPFEFCSCSMALFFPLSLGFADSGLPSLSDSTWPL